jgi:hypothetical protein
MEANKAIITAQEVIDSTPKSQFSDPGEISPFLILKEEGLFRVWLGIDFYHALLDDLASHAYVNFREDATYSAGDMVLWRDVLYECQQDTNGELPADTSFWSRAGKFKTAKNNYLWYRYLRTVLAWHIQHTSLVYAAVKQNALAVSKASTENSRPASDKTLMAFKSEIGMDLNDFIQTMDRYLREKKTDFPDYLPNKAGSCAQDPGQAGRPRRSFGFTCFDN